MTLSSSQTAFAQLSSKGWVSLNQFAKLPGVEVSYPTALRMKARGDIRGVMVGGVYRIYAKEVHRFMRHGNATMEEGVHPSSYQPDIVKQLPQEKDEE